MKFILFINLKYILCFYNFYDLFTLNRMVDIMIYIEVNKKLL